MICTVLRAAPPGKEKFASPSFLPMTNTAGQHSRQTARFFLSRQWLDKPLPSPLNPPAKAHLAVRLGSRLPLCSAATRL